MFIRFDKLDVYKRQSSALIDNLVAVVADFLEKLNSCFLKSALCIACGAEVL